MSDNPNDTRGPNSDGMTDEAQTSSRGSARGQNSGKSTENSSAEARTVTELDDLLRNVDEGQKRHVELATHFGRAAATLRAIKPYWHQLYTEAPDDPAVKQGVELFATVRDELRHRMRAVEPQLDELADTIYVTDVSTAAATGTTLATLGDDFRTWVKDTSVRFPERADPELERRLRALAPHLGDMYRSMFETLHGTAADPGRAAAFQGRELLGQFFSHLAPDEHVRASEYWVRKNAPGEDKIYRSERVAYAAHKYIKDPHRRHTLIAEAGHVSAIYKKLSRAHARDSLRQEQAAPLLSEVSNMIRMWLDAADDVDA